MKVSEILDQLDENREKLLVAIEPLPDEALLESGAMGDWSIADILAHLTAWESEMVTGLMQIKQGKKPTRMLEAFNDVDGYNARRYEENKGRDIDRIFDDLQGVRLQLEQWLEEFSDKDMSDPKRYNWSEGQTLAHIVEENSFGHDAEHLPEIESFAERWLAGNEQ
ncbi:MAG: DinB family protein [Candidatus Promineifilaceae bacterium]